GMYDRRYLVSYGLTMVIGYLFAFFVPKLGRGFLSSIENTAVIGFILFLAFYEAVKDRIQGKRLLLITWILFILMVGGVFALESLGVIRPLGGKFLRVINPAGSRSPLLESVAEHRRASWLSFFGDFGLTLSLALFGSYFAIRRIEEKRLFGIVFFLSGVYFMGSMIRLSLILSIPTSLMAAYGLKELLTPFVHAISRGAERRPRRRRRVFGIGRELSAIFTVFILVATLPTIWSTAQTSNRPTTLASSGVPVRLGMSYPQDWLQALAWMRDNLPDDAIVVSWWDYGYWIEAMANKTTLADGATYNPIQIAEIAKIMMFNHSDSLPILKGFGATHILVFNTFNPNNPEQQWPFGDNVKWLAMVQIAGLNESDYFSGGRYTEKFMETTLYRLMHMQADPEHFRLVFSSQYNFVLVYEIKYG
ncbi:MAG: hypothetical protein ACE5OO_06580, partial [Candidatus Bathyarchaeia archaeon]